ncbi:hydrogenase expression/formation C-terminal domain-containing protein [Thiolapillus sp.]
MSFPPLEITRPESGNLKLILHEISHALSELMATGNERSIDLRGIPLAPGEEKKLLESLGEGEIRAELDALGKSRIQESRYSGVWIVTHCNSNGEIMGRFIEITRSPALLAAQTEDMAAGLDALRQLIATGTES